MITAPVKHVVQVVTFHNWSDEEFTHAWNGVEHTFAPNESRKMEDWLAEHFAKHLADRECMKAKVPPVRVTKAWIDVKERAILRAGSAPYEDREKMKMDLMNEDGPMPTKVDSEEKLRKELVGANVKEGKLTAKEPEKKKIGRPKKVAADAQDFEGLKA